MPAGQHGTCRAGQVHLTPDRILRGHAWNVRTYPRSLRFYARELDHAGPFVDIFGNELGELVWRVRRHHHGAEISEPLLDVRVEHRRVGLLVERRDDLRRCTLGDAETDPASRLVADQCPLSGVKQRSQCDGAMAANDP
jgi:hypothetical protein